MTKCLKGCLLHNLGLFYSSAQLSSLLDMHFETRSVLGTGKIHYYFQWKNYNEISLGKAILGPYEGSLSLLLM